MSNTIITQSPTQFNKTEYRNCPYCGEAKTESDFSGDNTYCRACFYQATRDSQEKYRKSLRGKASRTAYLANYYAEQHGVAGTLTQQDVLELFEKHPKCLRCASEENLSVDHIKPMSIGGSNTLDNLQVLCRSCNSAKGQRIKNYSYRVRLGFVE